VTSLLVAAATVVFAALIGLAAYAGSAVLAAAVAFAALGLAIGWGVLLELPHRRGTSAVVALTGWASAGTAVLTAGRSQPLAAFAALVAGSVLLSFAHELSRRDGRVGLVESVTGTLSGAVIGVLSAGWILIPATRLGTVGVVVAAVAVGVSAIGTALPLDPAVRGWVGFGAGTGAAGVAAVALAPSRLATSLVLGVAVAAVVAGLGRLLASQDNARTALGMLSAAAAPVCAVGTVAYAVARLATG
jgi:hypothetical protein